MYVCRGVCTYIHVCMEPWSQPPVVFLKSQPFYYFFFIWSSISQWQRACYSRLSTNMWFDGTNEYACVIPCLKPSLSSSMRGDIVCTLMLNTSIINKYDTPTLPSFLHGSQDPCKKYFTNRAVSPASWFYVAANVISPCLALPWPLAGKHMGLLIASPPFTWSSEEEECQTATLLSL